MNPVSFNFALFVIVKLNARQMLSNYKFLIHTLDVRITFRRSLTNITTPINRIIKQIHHAITEH